MIYDANENPVPNAMVLATWSCMDGPISATSPDSHTIHWHGFRNPNAVFDGVPEVSISVPVARNFPYLFQPRNEGTYMYHCHFEDVEHVQMGMDGIVYIEADNGRTYDNDSITTAFARQFTLLFNEIGTRPHDLLENFQEFVWSEYKASYWLNNGRSYPDTIIRDQELVPGSLFHLEDDLYSQPVSSLIQLNAGETGLLRMANLGYEQQSMQLLGIPMRVVGHDDTFLGSNSYTTHTIYIDGAALDSVDIYLSTYDSDAFSVPGLENEGDGSDAFSCNLATCASFSMYFDGSEEGILYVDAIDLP